MENEAKIERIKTLMENFGVTQSEFAKRISIDASNFSKHLTGKLSCQRLTYQQNRRRLGRIERAAVYG